MNRVGRVRCGGARRDVPHHRGDDHRISGSTRKGSYNSMLLRAAVEMAPAGTTIEVASIREIPLYDGDLEAESGIPPPVSALKERIAAGMGCCWSRPSTTTRFR